ncbi:helix-turn-helix transcriptional regulator [Desertivirga arenae]|uniref:helix-turn-helix transcriptional regulator n=1 Tax=Desertivirga arenae TaxID=2810309 RepID=UPI001A967C8B
MTIEEKISSFRQSAEEIPGVVIIHNLKDLSVAFMNSRGLKTLGVTLAALQEMGDKWHFRFFDEKESAEYVPKIIGLLERNSETEFITLFQRVKTVDDWKWYHTSMKIFLWNETGKPILTIGIATPIDPSHDITAKVARLVDENNFLRENVQKFNRLTSREKEVLVFLAEGQSSQMISDSLFISVATVETHRRNIRRKLEAENSYKLGDYVRAFNLK